MKTGYPALWLLLATAFVTVCLLAFAEDINIGTYVVKKAPIVELLFPDSVSTQDWKEIATDSVPEIEEPKIVEVDSTQKSILLFGDSMTLNLALRLARYAAHNGHTMHAVNWDSSNTKIWAESDTLSHFIRKYGADYIFISLGSNELYIRKPETRMPYVKKILAKIGDIPYVWIGPPNWQEDSGINDMLEATCAPGSFFRSAGMSFKRKSDKIHPTRSSSADWMDSIMRWMPKSGHPILSDLPPDSLKKAPANVIFLKALNK